MAAQLMTLPFRPVINLQGGLEAGATLTVYLTGTTTPVSIYADSALSTELANPLTADARGVFPAVYFDDTSAIRVIIKDADGTTLSDTDPYITDAATVEASKDAAATSAAEAAASATAAAASESNAQTLVDGGYFSHAVTGTRYRYSVENGAVVAAIIPHVYLDPENGDDSWDGNAGYHEGGTVGPKKTRAGVEAHAAMVANASSNTPVTIGIRASDTPWRDGFDYYTSSSRNGNATRHYVSFVAYGGPMRKISCCDVVSKASFTAHATIANAYEVSVPHEMLDNSGANYTSLFINGERQCKQVANEADVATAGTWWAANGGRADAGVNLRIVVHFQGSVAPASVTGDIEVTTRTTAFAGQNNCYVEGIHSFGNGANNGGIVLNNYGVIRRCIPEEGQKHNALIGVESDATDLVLLNCTRSDDIAPHAAGNLLVCYGYNGGGTGFPEGASANFTRCAFVTDASYMTYSDGGAGRAQGFYAHAAGYIDTINLTDCWDSGMYLGSGSESGTINLTNYVSYSDFVGNTPVITTSAPTGTVNVEGGFLFGSCNQRTFDAYEVNIDGLVAVGNYGWLVYDSKKFTIEDSVICTLSGAYMQVYQGDGANLISASVNNNLFLDLTPAYHFLTSAPGAKLTADHNVYAYLTGGGGQHFSQVAFAAQAVLFSDWQALGYDANGTALANSNTAGIAAWFASGVRPTAVNLAPELASGTAPYQAVRERIDSVKIQRARNLPLTRATLLNYLKNDAPATPVLTT